MRSTVTPRARRPRSKSVAGNLDRVLAGAEQIMKQTAQAGCPNECGDHALMKDASAPIRVRGRLWGGLRVCSVA